MEAKLSELLSYSDVARKLKVNRQTVADIVNARGIPIYRHPMCGPAKCVDADGFRAICDILRKEMAQSA